MADGSSSYVPQPGHRVRRIRQHIHAVEGVVTKVSSDHVDLDGARRVSLTCDTGTVTWERLPDPAPEWGSGDVVLVDDTVTLVRGAIRWFSGSGAPYNDDEVNDDYRKGRVVILVKWGQSTSPRGAS